MHNFKTKNSLILVIYIASLLVATKAHSAPLENLKLKDSVRRAILKGDVYADSEVSDFQKNEFKGQHLKFVIAGLHPKSCRFALRKLSLYEEYPNYLDFVKKSQYDEKSKRLRFFMESRLLPFNMILDFSIPRIKKPGSYPFVFDKGFLKNLKGTINIYENEGKCLFYTTAKWSGPHSGINNTLFAFFFKGLGQTQHGKPDKNLQSLLAVH